MSGASETRTFKIGFTAKAGQGSNRVHADDPFLHHLRWDVTCFTPADDDQKTGVRLCISAAPHVRVENARFSIYVTNVNGQAVNIESEGEDEPEEFTLEPDTNQSFVFLTHARKNENDKIQLTITYLQNPVLTL